MRITYGVDTVPMNPEMQDLIDRFRTGRVPMLQFMKSMIEIKERTGVPSVEPELGKAVVAGRARHTEGRDLMAILLGAYGFETIVVDRDSSIENIISICNDPDVSVLCMSIQTTYDIPDLLLAHRLMIEDGIRDRIVYNAGGVAVSEEVAKATGCDVYGSTAVDSVEAVKEWVLRKNRS